MGFQLPTSTGEFTGFLVAINSTSKSQPLLGRHLLPCHRCDVPVFVRWHAAGADDDVEPWLTLTLELPESASSLFFSG